jgi:hypothetical protein
MIDEMIAAEEAELRGTVPLALMYEARANIALLEGDRAGILRMLEAIKPIYCGGEHPGLAAWFETLHGRLLAPPQARADEQAALALESSETKRIHALLSTGLSARAGSEQGDYLLSVLLAEVGAEGGCIYRIDEEGRPALLAARNTGHVETLSIQVARLSSDDRGLDATQTRGGTDDVATHALIQDQHGRTYAHRILWSPDRPGVHVGMVLVSCEAARLNALPMAFMQVLARTLQNQH